MEHLRDFKPSNRRTTEYQTLCEDNSELIKKCINLAIDTDKVELLQELDSRYKGVGRLYSNDGLEIKVFSSFGTANYVIVNYQGEKVLAASHEYNFIDLDDEDSEEPTEYLDIGRLIPGEWVRVVEKQYKKHFSRNPIEVIIL
ncbi:hypothetical protein HYU21_04740 [Candidatus Woesearchaeota archaeon]|nr:hypothetical protein [Candidatus Woesearchaeota archaeon]